MFYINAFPEFKYANTKKQKSMGYSILLILSFSPQYVNEGIGYVKTLQLTDITCKTVTKKFFQHMCWRYKD